MYGCFALLYVCVPCACSTHSGQKRVQNVLELELQVTVDRPNGCWELNSGFLQSASPLKNWASLSNPKMSIFKSKFTYKDQLQRKNKITYTQKICI